ncbi:uncharacterized protein LOC120671134 isoform X3 [Panicum virgatum]|uniref:uncharacterized protein LOC120671134 isoform X3 n=1 Tax=Panicum virgatum TaxID=38727 RepID=UPI0019D615C9|nr:uncharacterized protein LOC120671134 isoform X3 [Panicum virgatum]
MGDSEQDSTSHNPSHNSNAPLAIEPAPSKGKGQAASSSTKSTKRKAIEGYRFYYSERTGSSFIQTGQKRRVVSFGKSKSEAKATADGNASVVIETSAGGATSSARATINCKD